MTTAGTEIPNHLELVIEFVNTLDPDDGSDALGTPDGLATWLADRGLLDGANPTASERRLAIRLREALRSLMVENNGGPADQAAARELELAARRGQLGVHFDTGGSVAIKPAAAGFPGALAALLVPIVESTRDGSWQRVKACRASDCQWAFYDRSRNRSGVWCEMAVCGNRTKVRAHRARTAR